jgi:FMN-dependent NADH-azoreductase
MLFVTTRLPGAKFMTNILRIDASARTVGSHSRRLADQFLESWIQAHPGSHVVVRDLAEDPPPHISHATISAYFTPPEQADDTTRGDTALSDRYISELRDADLLIMSVPMYNFSVPSTLKAWIDHVVRFGQTFNYDPDQGFVGGLQGKRAVIATSSGAVMSAQSMKSMDFLAPYLRAVLSFIGFSSVESLSLEGSNSDEQVFNQSQSIASERIKQLAASGV